MATYYSNQPVQEITGSVRVSNFGSTVPVSGNITSSPQLARVATVTSVTASTESKLFVEQNPGRKQLWAYVTGCDLYLGPDTVTTSSYFLKIESGGFWELPAAGGIYTGELWGVFSYSTGVAQITEIR